MACKISILHSVSLLFVAVIPLFCHRTGSVHHCAKISLSLVNTAFVLKKEQEMSVFCIDVYTVFRYNTDIAIPTGNTPDYRRTL